MRYIVRGSCARAGLVAVARNRPVMKSRRLVKPTFSGLRAVAGLGSVLGASWATANRFHVICTLDGSPLTKKGAVLCDNHDPKIAQLILQTPAHGYFGIDRDGDGEGC